MSWTCPAAAKVLSLLGLRGNPPLSVPAGLPVKPGDDCTAVYWEDIVDRRCAALLLILAAISACMSAATAAAQDREAFLARQTINCPGCDLGGANLDRRDLTGADLSGADLRGATFSRTILRGTNFAGANLAGAPFKRHDLTGANLSGANLDSATLHRAILRGANLSGANLSGANLNVAVLTSANLQHAKLVQTLLFQVEAGSADFTRPGPTAGPPGRGQPIAGQRCAPRPPLPATFEATRAKAS